MPPPPPPSSLSLAVSLLRPRAGRFLPRASNADWLPKGFAFEHRGVAADFVGADDSAAKEEVRAYFRRHFYREAPIPLALGMDGGPPQVQEFIRKEMDYFLDAGSSLQFRRREEGDLVGVGLFGVWASDPEYRVLDIEAGEWHKAAAVVAKEMEPDIDPRVTWRDLQYQHLYNLAQKVLRRHPDRRGMVWASQLTFHKKVRELGLSEALISNSVKQSPGSGLILGGQSNFPQFDKFLIKHYNNAHLEEECRYADEDLEVDGVKVLQKLSKLDSMRFFVDVPKS